MSRKWKRVLIIVPIVLVVLYFGVGFAAYFAVGYVHGSCGPHAVNRPDKVLFDDHWPPLNLEKYAISPYESVHFPSRQAGINIAGWWA